MKSIRTKLVVFFGVPTAILLALLAGLLSFQINKTVIGQTETMSQEIMMNQAAVVGDRLGDYIGEASRISQEVFGGYMINMATILESRLEHQRGVLTRDVIDRGRSAASYVEQVFVVDALGHKIKSSGESEDASKSPYFLEVWGNNKQTFIGLPHISPTSQEPSLVIAHEIINDFGDKVGVLGIIASVLPLYNYATSARIGGNGAGWISDGTGLLLSHPDSELSMRTTIEGMSGLGYSGIEELSRRLKNAEAGTAVITRPNGSLDMVFFHPIPNSPSWSFGISVPLQEITKSAQALRAFTLWAFAVLMAFIIAGAVIMANSFAKPLKAVAGLLNSMAEGDLRNKVQCHRKDEIGVMTQSFNKTGENLQHMVQEIKTLILQASLDSQELSVASEESSASLEEVSASIQDFSDTATNNSKDARSMSKQAQGVLGIASHGTEQMAVTAGIFEKIAGTSKKSRNTIHELEKESAKIGKMINLIAEVAEQTNMLALNAAIEAARAGEHGRGFAVVADEVRALAEETQKSVEEIRRIVQGLSAQTVEAVQAIDENSNEVAKGIEALEKTHEDFRSITRSIQGTVESFEKVATSSEDLSVGSKDISSATEQQTVALGNITTAAESVAGLVKDLEKLIQGFSV